MVTRIVSLVIVALTIVLVVTGVVGPSTPVATSSAVQIPLALQLAAGALLLGLLSVGTNYVFNAFGLDLREYAAPVSVTIAAFLTSLAQGWINILPAQYDPTIQMIINILVVVVGGLGTLRLLPRRNRVEDKPLL